MYAPKTLDEYIGQESVKLQVKTTLEACKKMGKPFPHTLISGPPGTGKTTLAKIIANELKCPVRIITPAGLSSNEELFNYLNTNLSKTVPVIIFLDEIHRLKMPVEESLYMPMENNLFYGKGSVEGEYKVPDFTLIGATTIPGKLSQPLYDRFGLHLHMEKYSEEEIVEIIKQSATKNNISITDEAAYKIAIRSRKTPRIAINYLSRARDVAIVLGGKDQKINKKIVMRTFEILEVDETGLQNIDRKYLKTLYKANRPIGLASLVPVLDVDNETIKNKIEPYLLEIGLVVLTGKGRCLTVLGKEYVEQQLDDNGMSTGALEIKKGG